MSMNGNWLRMTPEQLRRALEDLDWAHEYALDAEDRKDERWFTTGKTFHALHFLLDRHGLNVPIVFGAESFVDMPDEEPEDEAYLEDVDWGYAPPGYLTPEQVSRAAAELAHITVDDLLRGVDPDELTRAGVYPITIWDRPGELDWATHALPDVARFFAIAAGAGDAVICWLS